MVWIIYELYTDYIRVIYGLYMNIHRIKEE